VFRFPLTETRTHQEAQNVSYGNSAYSNCTKNETSFSSCGCKVCVCGGGRGAVGEFLLRVLIQQRSINCGDNLASSHLREGNFVF